MNRKSFSELESEGVRWRKKERKKGEGERGGKMSEKNVPKC